MVPKHISLLMHNWLKNAPRLAAILGNHLKSYLAVTYDHTYK